jgi:hypothetical protein
MAAIATSVQKIIKDCSGLDVSIEDLMNNPDMMSILNVKKKPSKKTTKSPMERSMERPDTSKCLARTWAKGYGAQCSRSPLEGGCVCKTHLPVLEGKWWLGRVDEERPENPQHPKTGNHSWKTDSEGNEVVKPRKTSPKNDKPVKKQEEKGEKKKRGRPKGSKNKPKTDEEKAIAKAKREAKKAKKEETTQVVEEPLPDPEPESEPEPETEPEPEPEPEPESEPESEEEEEEKITVQGVEYIVSGDGYLCDINSGEEIAFMDDGEIVFLDEDGEETHRMNMEL